jgi:hypothetical protein
VTFNRALNGALFSGVLLTAEPDYRYRLILNYLNAFDAELSEKSFLVRSAFFEAIFDVLDEVVRTSLAIHKDAKKESLQMVVRPLARLNLTGVAGRALPTKKVIANLMKTTLQQNVQLSEEML